MNHQQETPEALRWRVRREVAEEIATACEAKAAWFREHRETRTATGLVIGAGIAREICSQPIPEDCLHEDVLESREARGIFECWCRDCGAKWRRS